MGSNLVKSQKDQQGPGRIFLWYKHLCDTYSGDNEGATDILDIGLDLAGDVQLVAVERDSLAVCL